MNEQRKSEKQNEIGQIPRIPILYGYGNEKVENGIQGQLQVFEEIVNLMRCFHSYNWIHNDIKPDNFMVKMNKEDNKGIVFLIDFGGIKEYSQAKFDKYNDKFPLQGQTLPWLQLCLDYGKAHNKNEILEKIKDLKIKLEPDPNQFGLFENALIKQIKDFEKLRSEKPSKYTTQIDYDLIIEKIMSKYESTNSRKLKNEKLKSQL
ncbi:ck1 ck1 ck1-d protein kinase [Stylonychia lemnae]|uniref:Ck1 ck1 ck1-d protein kinase n=1 Tax=Stylonychia lemnae TaxID=5949 RepID=A0A078A4K2_STYLE|nr:ck1 ck1 ck1-d protein kinase [Stylonychia lemnae]|eukprot:CDW76819.1 ck1 ck1 ck1-d protein kinase [Stylonychia lemnae]